MVFSAVDSSERDQSPGTKISAARLRRKLSQSDLARGAGISRQALFQIETGGALPRVDTAVRIARMLDMSVESLFGEGGETDIFLGAKSGNPGARVDLAELDGRWITHPSDDPDRIGVGFAASDGVIVPDQMSARTRESRALLSDNIFLAGCDPALEILTQEATRMTGRGRCIWIPCGNQAALARLVRGETHVAGVHCGGVDGGGNQEAVRKLGLHKSCVMLRFSSWEQGWMIAQSAKKTFQDIESLAGTKLRLANREAGSGCRVELDRLARSAGISHDLIRGYQVEAKSHADCARRIASGFADVGLGCGAMAKIFGLAFTPTVQVAFDLVIRRDQLEKPLVRTICDLVQSGRLLRKLACIPGYETSTSGHVVIS